MGSGLLTLNGGTLQAAYAGGGSTPNLMNNILVNAVAGNTISTTSGNNMPLGGNLTGSGTLTKIGGYSVFLAGNNGGFSGTYINASNTMFNGSRRSRTCDLGGQRRQPVQLFDRPAGDQPRHPVGRRRQLG